MLVCKAAVAPPAVHAFKNAHDAHPDQHQIRTRRKALFWPVSSCQAVRTCWPNHAVLQL